MAPDRKGCMNGEENDPVIYQLATNDDAFVSLCVLGCEWGRSNKKIEVFFIPLQIVKNNILDLLP